MSILTLADIGLYVSDAKGELLLERWAWAQKFKLFEEVFGLRLRLEKGQT